MELLIQQLLAGVTSGAIYACFALALVLIFQSTGHVNFAQGEMAMFSTFIAWQFMQWGLFHWPTLVLTIILSFIGGVFVERVVFSPARSASHMGQMVIFLGLFTVLNSLAGFIWDHTIRPFPTPFGTSSILGSGLLSAHQLGMLCVTFAILAGMYLFFRFTRIGLAMRAAAQDPVSSRLVGVRVNLMISLGWGMATAVGSITGMLIAPLIYLEPNMMLSVLLYGFAAAVLGGLNSPLGAIVGGIMVGIVENLAGTYIPVIGSQVKLIVALGLIIIVLVMKPTGLFGRKSFQRV